MQLAIPSYISPCHDIFLYSSEISPILFTYPLSIQMQHKFGRNTVPMLHKSKYLYSPYKYNIFKYSRNTVEILQQKSKYKTRPTRALLLSLWLPCSPTITHERSTLVLFTRKLQLWVLFTQKLGPQTDSPLLIKICDPYLWRPLYLNLLLLPNKNMVLHTTKYWPIYPTLQVPHALSYLNSFTSILFAQRFSLFRLQT